MFRDANVVAMLHSLPRGLLWRHCADLGAAYAGLQVAARRLSLPSRTACRLARLDVTAADIRRTAAPLARDLGCEVCIALLRVAGYEGCATRSPSTSAGSSNNARGAAVVTEIALAASVAPIALRAPRGRGAPMPPFGRIWRAPVAMARRTASMVTARAKTATSTATLTHRYERGDLDDRSVEVGIGGRHDEGVGIACVDKELGALQLGSSSSGASSALFRPGGLCGPFAG